MSTTADRRTPAMMAAARKTLERPLASYQLILGVGSILLGLGLIMVLSASSVLALETTGDSFYIFKRQLIFAVIGVIGAIIVSNLSLSLLRRSVYPILLVTTLLILATYTPLGVTVQGNRNWLPLFAGFQIQPSEFAKLAIVLWSADLYARKEKLLHEPRHLLLPMLPIAGVVTLLVVGQGDLGTSLVLFAVIISMLWVVGLPGKYMGAVGITIGVLLVFFVATAPHRVARLLNFTNPLASADAAGYQSVHSMMAFATGGFWGVGLGGSRQKWGSLPEAHTDFILSVIGEELGLFGSFVVVILFTMLAYTGVRIASRTKDPFVRYAAAGITIWLITQSVINIGMVLGLLPVIGIPLPLLSYGGSSLLTTLIALGLLANFAKTEPGVKRAIAASRKKRGSLRSHLPTLQRR